MFATFVDLMGGSSASGNHLGLRAVDNILKTIFQEGQGTMQAIDFVWGVSTRWLPIGRIRSIARLGGTVLCAAGLSLFPAVSGAQLAGDLDPGFGVGGKVTAPFSPNGVLDWSFADVIIDPAGKIIVAGSVVGNGFNIDFGVLRLLPNGTLDGGFGAGGEARIAFDFGADNKDYATCLALQEDGKIVVAGHAQFGVNDFDFAVARLEANGTLDGSFGLNGGITTVAFDLAWSLEDVVWGIALQPDGKIVLVGAAAMAPPSDFQVAVARLGNNGLLDPTFGVGGKTTIAFDLGGSNHDVGTDVALQDDGKIVIGGWASSPGGDGDFAAIRLNDDGSLDGTFGAAGKVLIPFNLGGSEYDAAFGVAIQPDGRIVLAGSAELLLNADQDFALARLLPNGSLDPSFGIGGKTTVFFDVGGDLRDKAYDVEIQKDGKIIATGTIEVDANDSDFAVVRLLEEGLLDPAFGGGTGRSVIPFNLGGPGQVNWDKGFAAAIQDDNKIIIAGVVGEGLNYDHFGVARLMTELIHLDGFESGDTGAWSSAVPVRECVVAFDDAYAALGQGSDPELFYGSTGVHFDNSNGFGVIGGNSNGDPGNWDIEGSNGPAAWGIWEGFHGIFFDLPVMGVSLDLLRGNDDVTLTLDAYLGGGLVGGMTLSLNGPFDVETAYFPGTIDAIVWDGLCCYGMDNLVFSGLPQCP